MNKTEIMSVKYATQLFSKTFFPSMHHVEKTYLGYYTVV